MRKEFLSEQVKEVMTEVSQAPQAMSHDEMETYRLHRRFDRMGRLIGDEKMKKLMDSHVMIIGLGGVGSWAAESIVRSGVGKVTLVDFDEICDSRASRFRRAAEVRCGRRKNAKNQSAVRGDLDREVLQCRSRFRNFWIHQD
jgi:tRNA A37 threonylcarbamoyladenosine dehydratase